MKVVVYQGQKKVTVDNISIPNVDDLKDLIKENRRSNEMTFDELQLCNFRITSTRGAFSEEFGIEDEQLEKEIEEGINWISETVN